MASSQPLVNVVTPLFNGEKYLAECIESVLAQTYENWEYVICDNCSTDRSLEIATEYAARNPRIRIVRNTEHVGVIQSWNRTIRQISPESSYCKTVHSDDWLFPECLERMVAVAERHPSVGIVGAYRLDEDVVNLVGLPPRREVFAGREICRAQLLGVPYGYLFGSPSSTLIRCDLIRKRDPFYNEANIHADPEACYDLLRESDFGFVHQVLTYTRRHNETVSTFTRRVGSYMPSQISVLLRYGPVYLTPDELDRRLAVMAFFYARRLAFLIRRRPRRLVDPDFRAFHARAIRQLAREAGARRLLRGVGLQLGRMWARRRGRLEPAAA